MLSFNGNITLSLLILFWRPFVNKACFALLLNMTKCHLHKIKLLLLLLFLLLPSYSKSITSLLSVFLYCQFIVSVKSVCCQSCCQPFFQNCLAFLPILVKILIHLLYKCTKIQSFYCFGVKPVWSQCMFSLLSDLTSNWSHTGFKLTISWYLLPVCSQVWQ